MSTMKLTKKCLAKHLVNIDKVKMALTSISRSNYSLYHRLRSQLSAMELELLEGLTAEETEEIHQLKYEEIRHESEPATSGVDSVTTSGSVPRDQQYDIDRQKQAGDRSAETESTSDSKLPAESEGAKVSDAGSKKIPKGLSKLLNK